MYPEELKELEAQSSKNWLLIVWEEVNTFDVPLPMKPKLKMSNHNGSKLLRTELIRLGIIEKRNDKQTRWSQEFKGFCGDQPVSFEVLERWIDYRTPPIKKRKRSSKFVGERRNSDA